MAHPVPISKGFLLQRKSVAVQRHAERFLQEAGPASPAICGWEQDVIEEVSEASSCLGGMQGEQQGSQGKHMGATLTEFLGEPNVRSGPCNRSSPVPLFPPFSVAGTAPLEQEQCLHQLTGLAHLCATWHPISRGDLVSDTARTHGDMQGGGSVCSCSPEPAASGYSVSKKKRKGPPMCYLGWLGILALERQRAEITEVGKVRHAMTWRMCRGP